MALRRRCALVGVVEADTLLVEWDGRERLTRLGDVLCERGSSAGGEPPTALGRRCLRWAREQYLKDVSTVDLEFPTDHVCLSNTGALLAYVAVRDEVYNVRLVREGFSPVFNKYGPPRLHREAMERAEFWARREGRGVWAGGGSRGDYRELRKAWHLRAGQVAEFRHAVAMGEDVLDCRDDYPDILSRARSGASGCVFADLRRSFVMKDGAWLIQLGSPHQPLCAYFPPHAASLAAFLEHEYTGPYKLNYLYFSGRLSMAGDDPQILIEHADQVAAFPPKTMS